MDYTLIGSGLALVGLVVWAVCVYIAWQQAPRRGRSGVNWAILTVFFGPLALFALYVLPRGTGRKG